MFGRPESVLHGEVAMLGQPRAALPGFAVSVLAYDPLALIARGIARAPMSRRPRSRPSAPSCVSAADTTA